MSKEFNKNQFIFHLDTDQKRLPLNEFIKIAKSLETTTDSVLKIASEDSTCQILIDIPEDGSYKLICGIAIFLGTAIGPDIINGVFEGIAGKDVRTIAKETTEEVVDTVKTIYRSTSDELRAFAHEKHSKKQVYFDKIIKAQNDFYTTLIKNDSIKAVGFSQTSKSDVKRSDFIFHTSKDIERDLPAETIIKELIISKSSNSDPTNKWVFYDKIEKKNIRAKITDFNFIDKFSVGGSPLKQTRNNDTVLVKLEIQKKMVNGVEKMQSTTITDIYKFNETELKKVPENLIQDFVYLDKSYEGQKGLFE